jgi:hypothetical protein
MKPFLQLNLKSDSDKAGESSLPKPEREEPQPQTVGTRVNRMAKKAAHRAGREFGRNAAGIFSK